jgi:hypothetical protein
MMNYWKPYENIWGKYKLYESYHSTTRGVLVTLWPCQFTLKSIFKAKGKNYGKLKYVFHQCQKHNLQKKKKKSSKRNQNPSRYLL